MSNVRKFLDLSTMHLDAASQKQLASWAETRSTTTETEYGWLVYAPTDPPQHAVPATLTKILEYARTLDCEYVLFDGDALEDDALPTFPENWS